MKKTLIVIVLSCLLLGLFCGPASAAYRGYSDISGHWAEAVIKEWSGLEVINGYPDGSFRPDGSITRGKWPPSWTGSSSFRACPKTPSATWTQTNGTAPRC
ncbi:MAG: S-layer homology domain-containing protein [Firmicutes bacterium]|nr:S-layer homology domain-containing protein [Bacillota bacterium]